MTRPASDSFDEQTSFAYKPGSGLNQHNHGYSSIDNDHDHMSESDASHMSTSSSSTTFQRYVKIIRSKLQEWNDWYEPYELQVAVALLILFTAVERVSFKMMIDRMLPYKFILLEIIFIMSYVLFSMVTFFKQYITNEITPQMKTFPHSKIAIMAMLDSVQFFGVVYSGIGVSPTMTVILMHISTVAIVAGSNYAFPNRDYGKLHQYGVILIGTSIFLSMVKIVVNDSSNNSEYFASKSAVIYIIASCLQGFSTVYKEKSLVEWAQPVNLYYISSWLFLYQFFITFGLSVLFYCVEAMMGHADAIPRGFYYGWMCFLGSTPKEEIRDDDLSYYVDCSNSMWLILTYVIANLVVLSSIDSVIHTNSHILGRVMVSAIFGAFLVLWLYDVEYSRYQPIPYIFGGSVGIVDILAVAILLIGMEIYGRDPEPDVEVITDYNKVNVLSGAAALYAAEEGGDIAFQALVPKK